MLTRLVGDFDIAFEWRGFELHPETPPGGMPLERLFPPERIAPMQAHIQRFAASFGVQMGAPTRLPNTRRSLAIAEYARAQGRLDPFRDAAMEAHWNRGLDLEDDTTLRSLAIEAGLDGDAALAATSDPAFVSRVDAMGEEAQRWGVTGIPTYYLLPDGWDLGDALPPPDQPRPVRIVGCQPYETVLAGCMRAGVRRRG